jgi:hypothetical protein
MGGQRSLRACRVEKTAHGRDPVGGKAYSPRVFLDGRLVGGEVNAVHLVAGYVAMEPLDPRHSLENVDRLLGNVPQLSVGKTPRSRNFPFDDEFRHDSPTFTNANTRMEMASSEPVSQISRIEKGVRFSWICEPSRSR